MIQGTKLHLGIQEPGGKIETYKSLRVDLFHDKENVKKALCRFVDDFYQEYDGDYQNEGVDSEPVEES